MKKIILSLYRWLFANTRCYKFNYSLYILALKGMGVLNYEDNKLSGERKFISHIARRVKNLVILDVGSNEGNYTALCNELCENASIYAFEPHPQTYRRLSQRFTTSNIKVFQNAASNRYEEVTLYDNGMTDQGTSHASLYKSVHADLHGTTTTSVKVTAIPLDDFLTTHNIKHVNLLKIDAEGHELKILMGIVKHLNAGCVDIIHFEFNEMNIISKTFMKDFYDLLAGYVFYRMLPNQLLPLGKYTPAKYEVFLFQNIVAIRQEFVNSLLH